MTLSTPCPQSLHLLNYEMLKACSGSHKLKSQGVSKLALLQGSREEVISLLLATSGGLLRFLPQGTADISRANFTQLKTSLEVIFIMFTVQHQSAPQLHIKCCEPYVCLPSVLPVLAQVRCYGVRGFSGFLPVFFCKYLASPHSWILTQEGFLSVSKGSFPK